MSHGPARLPGTGALGSGIGLVCLALVSACAPVAEGTGRASTPVEATHLGGTVQLTQLHARSLGRVLPGASLDYLVKALEEYTDLEVLPVRSVALDDEALLRVPWVRLPDAIGTQVLARDLGQAELKNLGRYLAGGGFLLCQLVEDPRFRSGVFDVYREALTTQQLYEGSDWRFVRLRSSHPIYHAPFDIGSEDDDVGLMVEGRLAALLARRTILTDRASIRRGNTEVDGTRLLQFVVNTVVFARAQAADAGVSAP